MGKAAQAPNDRKFVRRVGQHAYQRMGERFGEWLSKEGMLDERSRAQFLDFLIETSMQEGRFGVVSDRGRETTVVDISDPARWPGGGYAVLRDNFIITVLVEDMVVDQYTSGRWVHSRGVNFAEKLKVQPGKFNTLATALQKADVETVTIELTAEPAPSADIIATPAELNDHRRSRRSAIYDVKQLISTHLRNAAVEAFLAKNDQLAQVKREMADELETLLTSYLDKEV